QGRDGRDHPVDHRLSVFGFTDLEVAHAIDAGFHEVARGIDVEQAHGLAPDLPADDQAAVEIDVVTLERIGIARMHLAHRAAHDASDVEQAFGGPDVGRLAIRALD